jgi:predicted N-formylglutamate amidohydrolase
MEQAGAHRLGVVNPGGALAVDGVRGMGTVTSADGDGEGSGSNGERLLAPDEPAPFRMLNPAGRSSFLLVADHAGALMPRQLGDMGVPVPDRERHIALDLGVARLAEALSRLLDAPAIVQTYSRLVIDCNRSPERADAIPQVSDGSVIPANRDLGPADRHARVQAIHTPYHAEIAAQLARRDKAGEQATMVALHSFTPALGMAQEGPRRPWHVGVLYGGGDEHYALTVLRELRRRVAAPVGDNQPYAMDGIDFTIPHHCFAAARRYVELEIRQDLLTAPNGAEDWAALLAEALTAAL